MIGPPNSGQHSTGKMCDTNMVYHLFSQLILKLFPPVKKNLTLSSHTNNYCSTQLILSSYYGKDFRDENPRTSVMVPSGFFALTHWAPRMIESWS